MADSFVRVPAPADVAVTVDGKPIAAQTGELLIAAAERNGIFIPRFCWHPRMRPVGMCRMCLVEISGPRGPALQPACMATVHDGMVVDTKSAEVKKVQEGVLEYLLIHHPLDCPVCDRGGECPLQDHTMAWGPGESRFVEEKRHFAKPIPVSPLVLLDRERCILCDRCVRFAKEVAGDPLLVFTERGNDTQVLTFPEHPFASYFSGNTVQLCPVGALTATPYRFKARPWDLMQTESTCTTCAVGCRILVHSSSNRVLRYLGVDADAVNQGWLCDKGRFGFGALDHEDRLGQPLLRRDGRLQEASWSEAFGEAASLLQDSLDRDGPDAVGVLGGARGTNEDAYAWAKLAKGVVGTDNVDAQMGDGLPAEVVLGLPRATINDACAASAVVLVGADLKEELPVLYLRLRQAAIDGVPIVELSPRATGLTAYATVTIRYPPGELAATARALVDSDAAAPDWVDAHDRATAAGLLRGAPVVVVLGRSSLAESDQLVVDATRKLAELPGVRFLPALRRGNVHGALDMGLAPGVLPGRVSLDAGHDRYQKAWGEVPATRGLGAAGMLAGAAEGRVTTLVLLGADPLADFPDTDLSRRALERARVIAVDLFLTGSVRHADVVLPAAGFAEKDGTTTNLEGRVSRLAVRVTPPGTARPDWMIAAQLAWALGADLGLESLEDVWGELGRLAPSHAGLRLELLDLPGYRSGLVVPIGTEPTDPRLEHYPQEASAIGKASNVEGYSPSGVDLWRGPSPVLLPPPAVELSLPSEECGTATTAPGDDHAQLIWPRADVVDSAGPVPLPPAPGALRLLSSRTLYDAGVCVQRSPSLGPLAPGATLHVRPDELSAMGITDGDPVRVRSRRGEIVVPADSDGELAPGCAWLGFNQPDAVAGELIDATSDVTDVTVDAIDHVDDRTRTER
jgi:NADH-quinone oxidoreductase subunit G